MLTRFFSKSKNVHDQYRIGHMFPFCCLPDKTGPSLVWHAFGAMIVIGGGKALTGSL